MPRTLLVALVAASAAAAAPAPADLPPDEAVSERAAFLPTGRHQPLPGTAVGVLASDVAAAVAMDGRSGPPDALGFGRDGMSYRWVYLPAHGNPLITNLTLPVGVKGDKKAVFPALNMANPKTAKAAGVGTAYALVEVEVNDGAGSPPSEGFVATKVKVLDGTKEYPLDVAAAVERLKKTHREYADAQREAVDAGMEAARKKALGDGKPTGPQETAEVMVVTWVAETERLRVTFRTTVTDGAYQFGNGTEVRDPPALPVLPAPGGAVPVPPARVEGARFGTSYGVEFGRAYEVSRSGELVRTRTLAVEGFKRVLLPPPAAPRPVPLPVVPPKE
ncbi:hypothetical protein [Gemmata sp.]|uniref:hypothetical protein n=1 Tax=Gemmata sp. TaxID=1914242 RepID=UPI003F7042A0